MNDTKRPPSLEALPMVMRDQSPRRRDEYQTPQPPGQLTHVEVPDNTLAHRGLHAGDDVFAHLAWEPEPGQVVLATLSTGGGSRMLLAMYQRDGEDEWVEAPIGDTMQRIDGSLLLTAPVVEVHHHGLTTSQGPQIPCLDEHGPGESRPWEGGQR